LAGNFLAGKQAMSELRTSDAARYFHDASLADWDDPPIIEPAFIATAADGQVGQAAALARRLLELQPGNELAHLVIAVEAMKQRRYEAAASELDFGQAETFAGITGGILRAWALVGD